MKKILLLSLCMVTWSLTLFAQSGSGLKKFDRNGDGFIDTDELRAIHISKTEEKIGTFFSTDGKLDDALILAEVEEIKQDLFDKKFIPNKQSPIPLAKLETYYARGKKQSFLDKTGLLIRASDEDITLINTAQSSSQADAALLSLGRNYLTNDYSLIAKGALIRPINLRDTLKFADQLVPAILFNRVKDPEDSTNNANSLIGRLGYNMVIEGGTNIEAWIVKLGASYTTDFQFKSEIYAATIDVNALALKAGLGMFQPVWIFEGKWNLALHGEYGVCRDKGESKKLVEDDPFIRLGPKGTLSFYLKKVKNLEFTTNYTYLHGFDGSPKKFENFSQKASYALDSKKRIALSVEYTKGKLPLKLDEVENLLVGISIKL